VRAWELPPDASRWAAARATLILLALILLAALDGWAA
jgi:hypothetical protein